MSVSIRLSRIGKKHVPFFRIVAVDKRKKRDGAFLATLGTYDALNTRLINFNEAGIAEWEQKGAVLSDTVKRLRKLHSDTVAGKEKVEKKKRLSKKAKAKAAEAKATAEKPEEEVKEPTPVPEAPAQEEPKVEEPKEEKAPAEEKPEEPKKEEEKPAAESEVKE